MAFSTHGIQEVFTGATVNASGGLILPSGSINSYIPLTSGNPTVYEMIFGLVDTMADAVASGNLTNVTVSQSQSISGNTLVKRYNFTVNLDLAGSDIDEILNVKVEPSGS
jgi:hypothetical protein